MQHQHLAIVGEETMHRALLTLVSIIAATSAAAMDDQQSCLNQQVQDSRMEACSRVIHSAPHNAIAYYNRGLSYQLKGELDHAIEDLSKAIDLNPNYAAAYNSRGTVLDQLGCEK